MKDFEELTVKLIWFPVAICMQLLRVVASLYVAVIDCLALVFSSIFRYAVGNLGLFGAALFKALPCSLLYKPKKHV